MTATLAERLAAATRQLDAVTETPRLDAEILLARVMGIPRARLLARLRERSPAPGFAELVQRRLAHEPLAYILGEWEFFSLTFTVVPPLLVPRPETEHLVEVVLDAVKGTRARVLDIGTGTGCVALAIAHNAPLCRVVATDISPLALATASQNAARHGLEDRIDLVAGDLFEAVGAEASPFDVICSNPPYVEQKAWDALPRVIRLHESATALLAGEDGLGVIRRLVFEATAYLEPGGLLAFEIGEGQHEAVEALLRENNYEEIGFHRDLAGIRRIAQAKKRG